MTNNICKITRIVQKIKIIALSRLKQVENEDWLDSRRKLCQECSFNSINAYSVSRWGRILKFFSDFYSLITFNKDVDILGTCNACSQCSVYYKTAEKEFEDCPKGKWKSIKPAPKRKPRTKK